MVETTAVAPEAADSIERTTAPIASQLADGMCLNELNKWIWRPKVSRKRRNSLRDGDIVDILCLKFRPQSREQKGTMLYTLLFNAESRFRLLKRAGAQAEKKYKKHRTAKVLPSNPDSGDDVGNKKRERLVERLLDPLYKDARSPACFTSVEPLLREARHTHPCHVIVSAETRRYLARHRVYALYQRTLQLEYHRLVAEAEVAARNEFAERPKGLSQQKQKPANDNDDDDNRSTTPTNGQLAQQKEAEVEETLAVDVAGVESTDGDAKVDLHTQQALHHQEKKQYKYALLPVLLSPFNMVFVP
uniref:Uncharacterized protein n=1 Tax=Globodera rostochiensis TaxID=31243 RepID=A0A914H8C3_GLORO